MKPIDPANWITPDTEADDWLPQKRELMAHSWSAVCAWTPGSDEAVAEAAGMVRSDPAFRPTGVQYPSRLGAAAASFSDDFCVMIPNGESFIFAAGCVCAPTFWLLDDVIACTLGEVHGPIPGGDPGLSQRIARIFFALQPDTVLERFNWTVQLDGERFTPSSEPMKRELAKLSPEDSARRLFLRVERQTVRKLPKTGAVLFTIRVCVDPLVPILEDKSLRKAFEQSWNQTHPDLASYKGWPHYEAAVRFLLS